MLNTDDHDRMTSASIVTIAGDAGGAAALAPVLTRLQQDPTVALSNFGYFQAPAVFAQADIECNVLTVEDVSRVRELLANAGASLLLTATSVNALCLEKVFVSEARMLGCPSVGVLDFWSNYAERFTDGDGRPTLAPDLLAVMDERARMAVIAAGVASELAITGQPAFDALTVRRDSFTEGDRAATRQKMGAAESDFLILFVSQALDDLYGDARARLGFDQRDVLRLVMDAVAAVEVDQRIVVAVRKHPREAVSPADDYPAIDIAHDKTRDRWHAVMAADLVVGMNSVLLLEASYLGAAVISLQPGLRGDDMLPSNRTGGSVAAYDADTGISLVRTYLKEPDLRDQLRDSAIRFAPDGLAAQRVCACVSEQLARARAISH